MNYAKNCTRRIYWVFNQMATNRHFVGGWVGFNTNWDGHHDDGVMGRGGQFPLSENALSGW